jgi:2-phosphosulfolactate phosphatase
MRIDLVFTHQELQFTDKAEKTGVSIDVLRATSTIVAAFDNGCASFTPITSVDEARERAKKYQPGAILLGGAKQGLRPQGFDLGNSPLDYVEDVVKGKHILFSSSNGTQSMHGLKGAAEILLASFLNTEAVSRVILSTGRDCLIACSGDFGRFALGDTVCGGMIISQLLAGTKTEIRLSDAAAVALMVFQAHAHDIRGMLHASEWGQHLTQLNLSADIDFCAKVDVSDAVPRLKNDTVTL